MDLSELTRPKTVQITLTRGDSYENRVNIKDIPSGYEDNCIVTCLVHTRTNNKTIVDISPVEIYVGTEEISCIIAITPEKSLLLKSGKEYQAHVVLSYPIEDVAVVKTLFYYTFFIV